MLPYVCIYVAASVYACVYMSNVQCAMWNAMLVPVLQWAMMHKSMTSKGQNVYNVDSFLYEF